MLLEVSDLYAFPAIGTLIIVAYHAKVHMHEYGHAHGHGHAHKSMACCVVCRCYKVAITVTGAPAQCVNPSEGKRVMV